MMLISFWCLQISDPCEEGWTAFNIYCYTHFDTPNERVTFAGARGRCQLLGGDLATEWHLLSVILWKVRTFSNCLTVLVRTKPTIFQRPLLWDRRIQRTDDNRPLRAWYRNLSLDRHVWNRNTPTLAMVQRWTKDVGRQWALRHGRRRQGGKLLQQNIYELLPSRRKQNPRTKEILLA